MENKSDLSLKVSSLMGVYRSMAYDAIDEMLIEAFSDLGALMVLREKETGETLPAGKSVCGLSRERLRTIKEHSMPGSFDQYYSGLPEQEKMGWMMCFLDYDRIRREDFKSRFPNAFLKWTPEDDAELMEMFGNGAPWKFISERFGRNVNAVKIHIEKLGVDLGAEAGRRRYPATRPASADR